MGRASVFKSATRPTGQVEQQVASAFDAIKTVADHLEELKALAAHVGSLDRIFEIKYEDSVLYTRLMVDGEDAPWEVVADLSTVTDALSKLETVDQSIEHIDGQVALAELAKNTAEQIAITVENSRQQIVQLGEDFQAWLVQIEAFRDASVAARDAAVAARTAAESAKTAAETARTGAQSAQAGAVSARNAAATSETNASGHANVASLRKDEAIAAANLAKDWASQAQQYAESYPALVWGNVSGAITDQQDLITYIDSRIVAPNPTPAGVGSLNTKTGDLTLSLSPVIAIAGAFDPSRSGPDVSLSDGDLTATFQSRSVSQLATAGPIHAGGLRYFEVTFVSGANDAGCAIGVVGDNPNTQHEIGYDGDVNEVGMFQNTGRVYSANVRDGQGTAFFTVGTVVGVAVDAATRRIWFRTNGGTWNNSAAADPVTGVGGILIQGAGEIRPAVCTSAAATYAINLGAALAGALPWGAYARPDSATPSDVQITAPVDGQSLVYANGKWVNSSASMGGFIPQWSVIDPATKADVTHINSNFLPTAGGSMTGRLDMLTNALAFNNTLVYSSDTEVDVLNVRRYSSVHTLVNVMAPPQTSWGGARESTLALVRGDGNEYFLDLYNMDYGDTDAGNFLDYGRPEMGMRLQKRGTGTYTPFYFEYSDGSDEVRAIEIFPRASAGLTNDTHVNIPNLLTVQGQEVWHAGNFVPSLKLDASAFTWGNLANKPAAFTPAAHAHAIADVSGLQAALDGKQAAGSYATASHGHAIGDVVGLQTALDGKQAAGSYAAAGHTHSGYAADSAVVKLTGDQSVAGTKTFTGVVQANARIKVGDANAATNRRDQPRVFVQSDDPGAAAADGDLWIW